MSACELQNRDDEHHTIVAARQRLAKWQKPVLALKQKIVAMLLSSKQELHGMELDGDEEGNSIRDGIRERLEKILPEHLDAMISIEQLQGVNLRDEAGHTLIGNICSGSSKWRAQEFVYVPLMPHTTKTVFLPHHYDAPMLPEDATPDGPGAFQLSPEEDQAAHAAMVAKLIDEGELTNRLTVSEWVLRNVPQHLDKTT